MRALAVSVLSLCIFIGDMSPKAIVPEHIHAVTSCRIFDSYGLLSSVDEKPRLNNYAEQLNGAPKAEGIIIVSPIVKQTSGKVQSRVRRAIDYLVNQQNVNQKQIVGIILKNKGKEFKVELLVCPPGTLDYYLSTYEGKIIKGTEVKKVSR